ncbi:MAG: hypothetical protein CBE33_03760 [Candidatus Pelagibacter sp. TMED273]|nr:MAG: hypothetical protein CBE33_03760 [Candidatus Pelagibacter sp. TMED273]
MSLAMITWAIAWTNAKIVNEYLSYYNLIFLRFLLGFISILPFVIVLKKPFPKLSEYKYILGPSLLFLIYNIAFFKGTDYGLAGKGAILVTTLNPLFTVLIMSILYNKISKKEIVGVVLGIIGGYIIMDLYNVGFKSILEPGNIYFIICAISWGIMSVLINFAQKIINPFSFICICYLITMVFTFPFISITEIISTEYDFKFFINFFFVSMGAMSFGTSVYMYYTPILGPSKASIFIFSVPFLAISMANFFLNEPFTLNVVIGGILSLLAIYIVNKK